MTVETKCNQLIARTLQQILAKKVELRTGADSKVLVCIEGFSKEVFAEVKRIFSDKAEIYWAEEESGDTLVRKRNDTDSTLPLVIFTDTYFAESQSLSHFSRIQEQLLLENNDYRDILLKEIFPSHKADTMAVIKEATGVIINEIKPSLLEIVDYLSSSGGDVIDEETVFKNLGKELWRLGLFSYEKLINDNIRIKRKMGRDCLLTDRFSIYLRHNKVYSSDGYRSRFSFERVFPSNILDDEEKKILFSYSKGESIKTCYQEIDFLRVRGFLKKPRSEEERKKSSKGKERPEWSDVLTEIPNVFSGGGGYQIQFKDEEKFIIHLNKIDISNLFGPVASFEKWNASLTAAINNRNNNNGEDVNENMLDISISSVSDNHSSDTKVFSLNTSSFFSQKDGDIEEFDIDEKALPKLTSFTNEWAIFKEKRREIIDVVRYPGAVTLPLDVEAYVRSYLKLIKILWDNAAQWAQIVGFHSILKTIILLDMDGYKEEKDEFIVRPSHPFILFQRRLHEVFALDWLDAKRDIADDDETDSLTPYDLSCESLFENFSKNWPLYMAWKEGESPYDFNISDNKVTYRNRKIYSPPKFFLRKYLSDAIEWYLEKNPLAAHTLKLTVLNPHDGKEIFQALERLFASTNRKPRPESIYLNAIGPDNSETLSFFDIKVNTAPGDLSEMFLRHQYRFQPFCHYKKELIKSEKQNGGQPWLTLWLDKITSQNEKADKKKDIDIIMALDPFREQSIIIDNFMPIEMADAITRYFFEFENGTIDLLNFLTGSDRIHMRLAFEALSIMAIKRGAEKRTYSESNPKPEISKELMQTMLRNGKYAIVLDRTQNYYGAERLMDEFTQLEKKNNREILPILQEVFKGTNCFFLNPSQSSKIELKILDHLAENVHLPGWFEAVYNDFILGRSFWRHFFDNDRQWFIPLDRFPDWMMGCLVKNEKDDTGASPSIDVGTYAVCFQFQENVSQNTISYYAELIKQENKDDETKVEYSLDLSFLNRSGSDVSIFDRLKRKVFYNTLHPLVINPYQSWFLALLARGEILFKETKKPLMPKNNPSTIGKIKGWYLRYLTIQFVKLYSNKVEMSDNERHIFLDLFDQLKKDCPHFLKDFLTHLQMYKPKLFETNLFFKRYQ